MLLFGFVVVLYPGAQGWVLMLETASAFFSDSCVFAVSQQFPGSRTLGKPVSTLPAEKGKIWTAALFAVCSGKFRPSSLLKTWSQEW